MPNTPDNTTLECPYNALERSRSDSHDLPATLVATPSLDEALEASGELLEERWLFHLRNPWHKDGLAWLLSNPNIELSELARAEIQARLTKSITGTMNRSRQVKAYERRVVNTRKLRKERLRLKETPESKLWWINHKVTNNSHLDYGWNDECLLSVEDVKRVFFDTLVLVPAGTSKRWKKDKWVPLGTIFNTKMMRYDTSKPFQLDNIYVLGRKRRVDPTYRKNHKSRFFKIKNTPRMGDDWSDYFSKMVLFEGGDPSSPKLAGRTRAVTKCL